MNIPRKAINYLESFIKDPKFVNQGLIDACQHIIKFINYNNGQDFARHMYLAESGLLKVDFEKEHHPLKSINNRNYVLLGHWIRLNFKI
jgi:hypothetical protein